MAEEQIDKPNNEETTKSVNKSGNKRGLKSNNKQNFANNPEAARAAGKKKSTAEGNVKQSMQQTLTEGRERRITPLIQQDIRNAMIQPDKNGHTYMYDFINAFLKEAKDNPNSQPARMLGSVLFNDKLLQTLDEQVNKEMAKEREFASYRIRKTLFPKQTEVFDCIDKNIITIAGRRAGKSNVIQRILLNRCLRPGQHCLYMNLNFTNALNQCYDGVVDLAKELDIPIVSKSRAEGIIEFADDSYILFRGNSSIQDCEKTRGYSWTGIVVIDEIGSQKNLNYLIYDCIMPATKDATDSQILLAGTPPRIPHHTAEAIWNNPSWTHFHWDFRDNPYIPDHDSVIPDMCKAKGITPDSSLIKIELLGLVGEYDTDAMVYRGYKTYDKLPSQFNVTHAYIGVDPGYNDYTGIVGVVADRQLKQAYVIDEIKMNKCGVEDIAHAIIQMRNRIIATYGKVANVQDINGNIVNLQNIDANLQYPIIQFDKFPISVVIDTNEKNMNYTLAAQYKIPRVLAAWKHDKEMSIAQLAEWMRTGVIQIKKGGPVEDEALQTVYKRDPDTDAILNEIDDDIFHPDILDALRYVSVQFAYEIYQQGHTAREIAQELIRR